MEFAEKTGLKAKFNNFCWATKKVLKNGIPEKSFFTVGSFGDHLMCTAAFHEWAKRGVRNQWMLSHVNELFQHNPNIRAVFADEWRINKLLLYLGREPVDLWYGNTVGDYDRVGSERTHIIEEMLYRGNLSGEVKIRPYFYLTDLEKKAGYHSDNQVVIMSGSPNAPAPMMNKEWYVDRYQKVVDCLSSRFNLIQLGLKNDPPLQGVRDLRGKTKIRESASILFNSLFFVGQVGFLMHLARSVDCPSVIIFGGKEKPEESGYICNENLYSALECSPCWKMNTCEYERRCMDMITVDDVLAGVERLSQKSRDNLAVQKIFL